MHMKLEIFANVEVGKQQVEGASLWVPKEGGLKKS